MSYKLKLKNMENMFCHNTTGSLNDFQAILNDLPKGEIVSTQTVGLYKSTRPKLPHR